MAAIDVLGPRKTVEETLASTEVETHRLRRDLRARDVLVLGIGVIVGAGIFVLTGQAAATEAGPAIMLSFVLAGAVSAFNVFAVVLYSRRASRLQEARDAQHGGDGAV